MFTFVACLSLNIVFLNFLGDMVTNNHSTNIGISATSNYSDLGSTSSAMNVDVILSKPFAMVDEITEGSPAAEDGLQLGDQVVKFGHVEFGENLLQRLAAEAQANRGQALPMIVLRQGAIINLTVTPRVWEGRGLLGYVRHFFLSFLALYVHLYEHYLEF